MIITRGWGILGLLIPIAGILLGITFYGVDGNATLSILAYSLIGSGSITTLLGIVLQKKSLKKHDLYFLPLSVWGFIWIVAGVIAWISI
ncbi:hypothetical protein [Leeuwenhoekiella marinoflava]|uniref:hypothetical protein n=1 Tax=Leeuwenhoekiella marinoflava TaxID=988 RepID=UPI003000FBF5